MIVKPTVQELLEHAENRYALVIATSKRARQIARGDEKLTKVVHNSPVTIAANEIVEGKISICNEDVIDDKTEEVEENSDNEEN